VHECRVVEGTGDTFPFTAEWYAGRDHAPHLEQGAHVQRLHAAAAAVTTMTRRYTVTSICDLGAGDGGLLSQLSGLHIPAWGYDLQQNNVDHARVVRRADVELLDFVSQPEDIAPADLTVITECLEHLDDPHAMVRWIAEGSRYIVASSPFLETEETHDDCHVWVWDDVGYEDLLSDNGFEVVAHEYTQNDYGFQIVSGVRR
jgi:hypothetical protein